MNIHLTLDCRTILRKEPRSVHLVARLTAQKLESDARPRSAAALRLSLTDPATGISEAGSTNLMASWLLGRDELLKVGAECDKKILVLTEGHLNQGIIE